MCLLPELEGNGIVYISRLVRGVAEHHRIPVVLHLDHATELDLVKAAIDQGFTSVMIDGSQLPLAENIRLTQATVDLARPHASASRPSWGTSAGWTWRPRLLRSRCSPIPRRWPDS